MVMGPPEFMTTPWTVSVEETRGIKGSRVDPEEKRDLSELLSLGESSQFMDCPEKWPQDGPVSPEEARAFCRLTIIFQKGDIQFSGGWKDMNFVLWTAKVTQK